MRLNNLKFISFFCFVFLVIHFLPLRAEQVLVSDDVLWTYVNSYINTYGLDKKPDNEQELYVYDKIQNYLMWKGIQERPEDLTLDFEDDTGLKISFIRDFSSYLKQQANADYLLAVKAQQQKIVEQQQQAIANTTEAKNDPTKEDFQIVQPECVGDQSNNKHVQGMSVKDSGYCGWRDLIALINRIIKFCVYIAAALSAISFAYAGFLYMTAFGSSGKIEEAHGIFKKTFMGILFVLMGWLLVYTLLQVLGNSDTITRFSILKQP